MNGRFLLDTNAIIALFERDQNLLKHIANADWIGISVISELEFLAYPSILLEDALLFQEFKGQVEVVGLDHENQKLLDEIIKIRRKSNLKLPDSIVAATANIQQSTLLTNDAGFKRVVGLPCLNF